MSDLLDRGPNSALVAGEMSVLPVNQSSVKLISRETTNEFSRGLIFRGVRAVASAARCAIVIVIVATSSVFR